MAEPQQDPHARALERYQDAREEWQENHTRMREDLRFSNPADPQQWPAEAKLARKDRIMHTHDRTNQYKAQVTNSARKNRPGILTVPADSRGDVEVAKRIDGIFRHIEYISRAAIAYDTAIGHSADCGVGWIRPVPRVVSRAANYQEWRIERVIDPLSIVLLNSLEPDGRDATDGFAETWLPKDQFTRRFPKAEMTNWAGLGQNWYDGDRVMICEHQYVVEEDEEWVTIENPDTGDEIPMALKDYEELGQKVGFFPPIKIVDGKELRYTQSKRRIMWNTLSGAETLEETEYPSNWIGMVPVIGYETFVDGKRYLCGLTRRLRDGQIDYNMQRTAGSESVAMQPKAPLWVPAEGIKGHEKHYAALNLGNPAYLPSNAYDPEGRSIPRPERLQPATVPTAFIQGAQQALSDMEAAIGMLRTSGDAPPASASGRALRERANAADTATFHFPDNQAISIEQVARIIVAGIPRLMDTKRVARIIGQEGQHDSVTVDPAMPQPILRKGRKVIAVNFNVGEYDVRMKVGPSYTSQRESAAEGIEQILSAAPQFTPVLGPQLVKLRDFPDADRTAKMMIATLPPELQKIWNDGDESTDEKELELNECKAALEQAQAELERRGQMLDAGSQELQRLEEENQAMKSDQAVKQAEAQVRTGELALKGREVGIREREMVIKEQEAEMKLAELQAKLSDTRADDLDRENLLLKTAIAASKEELDAYRAETERLRVEQDGLIAEMQANVTLAQDQIAYETSLAMQEPTQAEPTEEVGEGGEPPEDIGDTD